jgi:uncharacterized protein YbjT (DUF2867 family)
VTAASRSGNGLRGAFATRFDWYDTATHPSALAGVERMYLVPPSRDANPQAVMLPFLEQARNAGVRRVVLLSNSVVPAGGPGPGVVHEAIAEMFDEWAVLRPSWFMQNVTGNHPHAQSIRADSVIRTATDSGRVGFVDAGDIARVGIEALLSPAAPNADLILTGPEALSYDEVAVILSEASGRTITHVRLVRSANLPPPSFGRDATERVSSRAIRLGSQASSSVSSTWSLQKAGPTCRYVVKSATSSSKFSDLMPLKRSSRRQSQVDANSAGRTRLGGMRRVATERRLDCRWPRTSPAGLILMARSGSTETGWLVCATTLFRRRCRDFVFSAPVSGGLPQPACNPLATETDGRRRHSATPAGVRQQRRP